MVLSISRFQCKASCASLWVQLGVNSANQPSLHYRYAGVPDICLQLCNCITAAADCHRPCRVLGGAGRHCGRGWLQLRQQQADQGPALSWPAGCCQSVCKLLYRGCEQGLECWLGCLGWWCGVEGMLSGPVLAATPLVACRSWSAVVVRSISFA